MGPHARRRAGSPRTKRPTAGGAPSGPETPWLTLAIWRFLNYAEQPFPARFAWPEVATTNRDRRTGLPWYAYFADLARLYQEVPGLGAASTEVAFLDLAGFGAFNNRHGMAMGDAVLREFAQALAEIPGTMAIRDGGDEFLSVGPPGGYRPRAGS